MPYTRAWDETAPLGSAQANTIDDLFRNLKVDLRERFADVWGLTSGEFAADPLRPKRLIPAATGFAIRNNANTDDNFALTDAGAATIRAGLTVTTGNVTVSAGNVGVGVSAAANAGVYVFKTLSTSAEQYGALIDPEADSAATTAASGIQARVRVANSAFTCAAVRGVFISTMSKGASATVTNCYGLYIQNQTGATTNYAIYTEGGQVRFGDNVLITGTATHSTLLDVSGTLNTGTSGNGVLARPTFGSTQTGFGRSLYVQMITAAASFTLATGSCILVDTPNIGAGSAVTTLYGLYLANINQGSTNFAIYTNAGPIRFGDTVTVVSANGNALVVGPNGATNPVLKVNASGASQASGVEIAGFAAGSGTTITAISSATDEPIVLASKGSQSVHFRTAGTNRWNVSPAGHLLAAADNTYDIGASGATRPRHLYIAGTGTFGDAVVITSTSASAFVVGANGATNPVLRVDSATASVATGIKIAGAAAGAGVELAAISSGTNEALSIEAKGSGLIKIGSVSTGKVEVYRGMRFTGPVGHEHAIFTNCTVSGGSGSQFGLRADLTFDGATIQAAAIYSKVTIANSTVPVAVGLKVANASITTGTITTQYGVFVEALTVGGTNIPLELVNAFRVDMSATADDTRALVYDVTGAALKRISRGAVDSGGTGFRVLRIPN